MPRQYPGPRKRRTREHIIAEMAVNFVEGGILERGHALERIVCDYGIDALLLTFDRHGDTQNVYIPLQIKATDRIRLVGGRQFVAIRVERADLRSWLTDVFPVILIVYDAQKRWAYWLYVQAYFGTRRFAASSGSGKETIRIPASQVFDHGLVEANEVDRLLHADAA